MPLSEEEIQELVQNPSENLSVELKEWIDPNSDSGKAKLIKGCFALRNFNGGFMLIGFEDSSGLPTNKNAPQNIREVFHSDVIQGLITHFASECFEIEVKYPEVNSIQVVVIQIPSGIKTPVLTKRPLDQQIKANQIYVRTLNANNTPSSSEIRYQDWPDLLERCFENREADIGRFIRRHLTRENLDTFLMELGNTLNHTTLDQQLTEYLEESKERYNELVTSRNVNLPECGSFEVAVLFGNTCSHFQTDQDFMNYIWQVNPRYTGWPVWVDSRGFRYPSTHPIVYNNNWEALIVTPEDGNPDHIDFWRMNPKGKFYLYRALQDDIHRYEGRPPAGTMLDFKLAIDRVAECIGVILTFARGMDCPDDTILNFVFRWSGLNNRVLGSWVDRGRDFSIARRSQQDVFVKSIQVPVDTAPSAVAGYVYEVISGLFLLFEGFRMHMSEIERIVNDFLSRHY